LSTRIARGMWTRETTGGESWNVSSRVSTISRTGWGTSGGISYRALQKRRRRRRAGPNVGP
jgi:hypothetical protein